MGRGASTAWPRAWRVSDHDGARRRPTAGVGDEGQPAVRGDEEARRGEGGSVCGGGALLRSFLSLSSVREVEDGMRGRRRRDLTVARVQIGRIWADRPKNWAGAPAQSAAIINVHRYRFMLYYTH